MTEATNEAMTDPPAPREEPPTGRFALLDRVRAIDRVEWAMLALFALSLVLHLWDLGARAFHHDESQHAAFSYYFATGGGYQHNPLLHGPSQFHAIALIFKIFGDSDFTARVYHAVMGSLLVLSPLFLRRRLGGIGTVLAAAFLVISPSILYFSRFAREDIPVAVFTVMIFIGIWRYLDDRRLRWLLVMCAGFGLSFASKETAYLTAAVVLLYLDAALAHSLYTHQRRTPTSTFLNRVLDGLWLLPTAWIFAAVWGPLAPVRRRLRLEDRPPEADALVVVGTLVLPELAALSRIPMMHLNGSDGSSIEVTVVLGLLFVAAFAGWIWRFDWWLACAAVFFAVSVPLYMTMGTNPAGIGGLFWNSLSYWLDQQGVRRGTQPWFYYFMMVPLYESLTLLPALAGGLWLSIRRGDHFASMLLAWFGGTFVALSFAGEKMPWLTVHMALPLALLAAYVLGIGIPKAWRHVRAGDGAIAAWAGGGLATAVLGIALVITVRTDLGLNVWHPDTPVEPLIYVQTTPEVPPLAREMIAWIADGRASSIVLDDTGDTGACGADSCGATWPWAWYLRHQGIIYTTPGQLDRGEFDPKAIVIRPRGVTPAPQPLVQRQGNIVVYRHRWWFPEDAYRDITWGELASGVLHGKLIGEWARFVWDRGDPLQIGSLDGEVYFPPTS